MACFHIRALCCCLLIGIAMTARAQPTTQGFPRAAGAVNDFASVLAPEVQATMEGLAREILDKTGTAVVVATVKTVGDSDPDMYANELYEAWGIGRKGEDKGVLIFLALAERKVRIETGYGVEGLLPDGLVGSILDEYALPLFRQGQYDRGLLSTMAAVGRVLAKDAGVSLDEAYQTALPKQTRPSRRTGGGWLQLLVMLFVVGMLFSRRGRGALPWLLLAGLSGRAPRLGGGFGGGGFSGGFGGFGGGLSGGGGASRGF